MNWLSDVDLRRSDRLRERGESLARARRRVYFAASDEEREREAQILAIIEFLYLGMVKYHPPLLTVAQRDRLRRRIVERLNDTHS